MMTDESKATKLRSVILVGIAVWIFAFVFSLFRFPSWLNELRSLRILSMISLALLWYLIPGGAMRAASSTEW